MLASCSAAWRTRSGSRLVAAGVAVICVNALGPVLGVPSGYQEFALGGTSSSTPVFVGLQANAEQAAGSEPIGFANPVIYARYRTPAYHDVTDHPLGPGIRLTAAGPTNAQPPGGFPTQPRLSTFGLDQGLDATPGYDNVTGIGTLTPSYFASYRER